MTNGERIKYLREKNGFTQKDIATKLGVEPAAISKYELDMREPNIEALIKLATIFNVSIDYLLGRTPDVFVNANDKKIFNLLETKELYYNSKEKLKDFKKIYTNNSSILIAGNEICAREGDFSQGYKESTTNISMIKIESLLDDITNSELPIPQILIKLRTLKDSIIIIEIDCYDDEEMPISANDRMLLYTSKFSQNYNVLGLAMTINEKENCKIINSVYQGKNEDHYTQLHLPKTVLSVGEYVDVMSRI